jgi:CDP-glucose 4,6-dehydratase
MEAPGLNRAFWRDRRVLVTGHTGFKGSWLALWLQRLGANVSGIALPPPTTPSLFDAARVGHGMRSSLVDLRDAREIAAAVSAADPEIVLHLAAQSLVMQSYADPIETYATNVIGTVHLLEAVRRLPTVRAVVVVSSDKCYQNNEWPWGYRESDAMGGFDPYSSSKGCVELLTAAYRNSFFAEREAGAAIATARAGNVIGGGDWARDRLIPDCLRAIDSKEPVGIRHPEAVRPWQHVLDPLAGYLALAERLHGKGRDFAEAWNFGPGDDDARTVRWLVERFIHDWGDNASWRADPAPHPHEASYLKLDCSKARLRLDWRPRWPIEIAIGKVCAWHRAFTGGADMRDYTLTQIGEFESEGAR